MESKTEELVRFLKGKQPVKMLSVFSHLAASPLADHDDFTHLQARRFQKIFSFIQEVMGISQDRLLLNSAGIFIFPHYHYYFVTFVFVIYIVVIDVMVFICL